MNLQHHIKQIALSILLIGSANYLFSQESTIRKADTTKTTIRFLDAQRDIKPLNFNLIDPNKGASILNFKPFIKPLGFAEDVNNYFDPFNTKKKKIPNFMSQSNEIDSDILVKKHFNGRDMSNVQVQSNFSLGTLETNSESAKIEVRDHSLVDGDRIKIYVNGVIINSNIMLNGISYIINVDLKPGYNRIDIEALNEGYSGPNTAELRVFDDAGYLLTERDWNISTGHIATLGIIKN